MVHLTMNELPERIDPIIQYYVTPIPSVELKRAIEYTVFNGGKRLRPRLVYAAGLLFKAPLEALDIPACAVVRLQISMCANFQYARADTPSVHKRRGRYDLE